MNSEYEKFLYDNYKLEITNLLNDHSNSTHASIVVNLNTLKSQKSELYSEIVNNIQKIEREWNVALLNIQKKIAREDCFLDSDHTIKENCHVRFTNLPSSENILSGTFPDNECIGLFVQVKGNVVQMSQEKLLEIKREMICSKCNSTFIFEAQYGKMYKFDIPEYCLNIGNCRGLLRTKNNLPKPEYCMDFQQIKIQEFVSTESGNYPTSLTICLEDDLVNTCKPGECVTVCGTVEVRWRYLKAGSRGLHILSLRANSVVKDNSKPNVCKDFDEQMFCAQAQWQENVDNLGLLNARNLVVNSLCPEIIGMSYIKLGLALALSSGFHIKRKKVNEKRDQSHVLLVGDSGTGKSKLLKAVCQISVGAIHTNGLGCSVAGLTAAAFKDGSDWNLQAGALVLADGGLCCIDQFNLMHQHDKAAVHETMEQQTISIAKAGLVCKLQTQCVILASANFKTSNKFNFNDRFNPSNLDIGGPLLSRFDLIFSVSDERETEWDLQVTEHLLNLTKYTERSRYEPQSISHQRLQSHFMAVREINPKFHNLAHILLGSYYKYYRSNFQRDLSRTTVRMLDSINRLAQSHARLMFRNKVLAFDAIVVIELLEATWGFGKIIKNPNSKKTNGQLTVDNDTIITILNALDLIDLKTHILEEKQFFLKKSVENNSIESSAYIEDIQNNAAQNEDNEILIHQSVVQQAQDPDLPDNKKLNKNQSNILNYFRNSNVNTSFNVKYSNNLHDIQKTRSEVFSAYENTSKNSLNQNKFLFKSPNISSTTEKDQFFDDDTFEEIFSEGYINNKQSNANQNKESVIYKREEQHFKNIGNLSSHNPQTQKENLKNQNNFQERNRTTNLHPLTTLTTNSKCLVNSSKFTNEKTFTSKNIPECSESLKKDDGIKNLLEQTKNSTNNEKRIKNFWNFTSNSFFNSKQSTDCSRSIDNTLSGNNSGKRPFLFDDGSEADLNLNLDLSKPKRTKKEENNKKVANKVDYYESFKEKETTNSNRNQYNGLLKCLATTDNLDFLELNF